jgi:ADP-ribosyl-[dinitrogen reductase] hydrolase
MVEHRCPQCGSSGALPVAYGLPSPELFEEVEAGKVALGGCIISGDDPDWFCPRCGVRWREHPDGERHLRVSSPYAEELEQALDAAAATAARRSPALPRGRYRGVLLGLAVGNALGLPVEGRPPAWIRDQYPEGLREIDRHERERPWDDDLAQTVILAEMLAEHGELDLEALAASLVRWADENGRGIGSLTHAVITELAAGAPPSVAARQVWERGGGTAAGNGAVMRCAPVALRWRHSGRQLVEQTWRSAIVTHADPRCPWSAVALNAALALALQDEPVDLERLAHWMDDAGAPPTVGAAIRGVVESTLDALALDDSAMGYTLKAMQVGLWCLVQPADFEDVLVAVVNAGGDTDTNGAVAGAVMGSRVGLSGIPARWLENIRDTDRIVELADALFLAVQREIQATPSLAPEATADARNREIAPPERSSEEFELVGTRDDKLEGIARALRRLTEHGAEGSWATFLAEPSKNYFVQVAISQEGQRYYGEAVSNDFLRLADWLKPDQLAELESLGWSAPPSGRSRKTPNYYRNWETGSDEGRLVISESLLSTLERVYGLVPGGALHVTLGLERKGADEAK